MTDREKAMEEARRIRASCLSEDCIDVEPVIADALLEAKAQGVEWRPPGERESEQWERRDRAAELRAQKGESV